MADLQVGNVGTSIQVTIKDQSGIVVNLSTSTTRKLFLRKPEPASGTVLIKAASLVGGGTGGIMEYVTVAGDLDVPGAWGLQAKYINSVGTYYTNVVPLPVLPNLAT